MDFDTPTQHKEIHVSMCIRMPHHIMKTVQDKLRMCLLKTIYERVDKCVSSTIRHFPHFKETYVTTGLTYCEYSIDLPLRVNKAQICKNRGGCMAWAYKPFYKTERFAKYMENELQYILKRQIRSIDPLGLAIRIVNVNVSTYRPKIIHLFDK